MPQFDSIAILDRKDTPETHTFQPYGKQTNDPGVSEYREGDPSGIAIGDNVLTIKQNRTADRVNSTLRLTVPVLTTDANGVTSVARVARGTVSLSFDRTSTDGERDDFVGLLQASLASDNEQVNAVLVLQDPIY